MQTTFGLTALASHSKPRLALAAQRRRGMVELKRRSKTAPEVMSLAQDDRGRHVNLDEPESLKIYPGSITIAQKPYIIGSLGPKALTDQSFEGKG